MSTKAVRKIEVKEAKKVKQIAMPVSLDIIILALGICLLIWADKVTSLISVIIGATFLVYAAYNFIAYVRVENKTSTEYAKLITGIALAIAGAFLIFQKDFIKEIISLIIGIFVLVESIFRLQDTLNSRHANPNYKNALILSVIGVVCGALCIFGKIIVPDVMLQVLGVMLIIFAFVDMAGGIMVSKSIKTVNAKIIDEKQE